MKKLNKNSICNKCNNEPCKNMETIAPDSSFLISAQFKLVFNWIDKKIYIKECSGFNVTDFFYINETNSSSPTINKD
jgi:hypothetical protein